MNRIPKLLLCKPVAIRLFWCFLVTNCLHFLAVFKVWIWIIIKVFNWKIFVTANSLLLGLCVSWDLHQYSNGFIISPGFITMVIHHHWSLWVCYHLSGFKTFSNISAYQQTMTLLCMINSQLWWVCLMLWVFPGVNWWWTVFSSNDYRFRMSFCDWNIRKKLFFLSLYSNSFGCWSWCSKLCWETLL